MNPLRPLLALRSPAGRGGRLTTLSFHRVLAERDPLFPEEIDATQFDVLCRWLAATFNVIPLAEGVRRLRSGTLPARAAVITFDDGYADNHDIALPILRRHGISATFFIASGFLDGGRMFNDSVIESIRRTSADRLELGDLDIGIGEVLLLDGVAQRRRAIDRILPLVKYLQPMRRLTVVNEIASRCCATLPDDLMMTATQVRALRAAGMELGAHTHQHPILARLSPDEARDEIARGRHRLEEILGEPVTLFAYPNGKPGEDYHAGTAEVVRQLGFDAAVTTAWGAAAADTDLFQIPRFTPWDRNPWRFGWRLFANLGRPSRVQAPTEPRVVGEVTSP